MDYVMLGEASDLCRMQTQFTQDNSLLSSIQGYFYVHRLVRRRNSISMLSSNDKRKQSSLWNEFLSKWRKYVFLSAFSREFFLLPRYETLGSYKFTYWFVQSLFNENLAACTLPFVRVHLTVKIPQINKKKESKFRVASFCHWMAVCESWMMNVIWKREREDTAILKIVDKYLF